MHINSFKEFVMEGVILSISCWFRWYYIIQFQSFDRLQEFILIELWAISFICICICSQRYIKLNKRFSIERFELRRLISQLFGALRAIFLECGPFSYRSPRRTEQNPIICVTSSLYHSNESRKNVENTVSLARIGGLEIRILSGISSQTRSISSLSCRSNVRLHNDGVDLLLRQLFLLTYHDENFEDWHSGHIDFIVIISGECCMNPCPMFPPFCQHFEAFCFSSDMHLFCLQPLLDSV